MNLIVAIKNRRHGQRQLEEDHRWESQSTPAFPLPMNRLSPKYPQRQESIPRKILTSGHHGQGRRMRRKSSPRYPRRYDNDTTETEVDETECESSEMNHFETEDEARIAVVGKPSRIRRIISRGIPRQATNRVITSSPPRFHRSPSTPESLANNNNDDDDDTSRRSRFQRMASRFRVRGSSSPPRAPIRKMDQVLPTEERVDNVANQPSSRFRRMASRFKRGTPPRFPIRQASNDSVTWEEVLKI